MIHVMNAVVTIRVDVTNTLRHQHSRITGVHRSFQLSIFGLGFIKDKISFDAYVKAEKFVQNIQDCRDGNNPTPN